MGIARDDNSPTGTSGAASRSARCLELNLRSDPAVLAPLRKSIERFAELTARLDAKAAGEVGLCVNEAIANVIRHAYAGRDDQPIRVTLEALDGGTDAGLRVKIRDWGNGVDPSTLPPAAYDPLTPGGVGLICLQTLLDEVDYTAQPDGMLTTLTRRRQRPAASATGRPAGQAEHAMTELKTGTDLVTRARQEGDTLLAEICGEIDLHNSPEVRTALLDLVAKHQPKKLILNVGQVPYMDSSAIAVLVETLQKMRKHGGKIYLTKAQSRVQGLLEIARLDAIFSLTATDEEAMEK